MELPIITPQQLRVSRKIRYMFTGNLEKSIITNPHFPGKEKHLLKCQVVRINAATTVCPRTMYNVNAEDPKEVDPVEDWKWPPFDFISQL